MPVTVAPVPPVSARGVERQLMPSLCLSSFPNLYSSINFKEGETAGTGETNVRSTRIFAVSRVDQRRDSAGQRPRAMRDRDVLGSLSNAAPRI
jgi:hypothetical protein